MFALLPWLLGLAVVALFWWRALGARSNARRAAIRACADAGVTFIDELALQRLWVGRGRSGRLCLTRRYGFEFYHTGRRRYAGEIHMRAERVARVQLDPYPFEDA